MPDCARSKTALDIVEYNHRPGIAELYNTFMPIKDHFHDDRDLSQDISKVTLKSFFEGAGKSETRKDTQRVFFWGILSVLLLINHFYWFVWVEDDGQRVVQLEPHPSYFHYQAARIRHFIE